MRCKIGKLISVTSNIYNLKMMLHVYLILHVKKPMKPLQKAALSKRPLWLMLLEIIMAATVDLLDVLRLEVDSAKVDTK